MSELLAQFASACATGSIRVVDLTQVLSPARGTKTSPHG